MGRYVQGPPGGPERQQSAAREISEDIRRIGSNLAVPGAISVDVAAGYASYSQIRDERMAMRVFVPRWERTSKQMAAGENPDGFVIGPPEMWPKLAPLLATRAKLLSE